MSSLPRCVICILSEFMVLPHLLHLCYNIQIWVCVLANTGRAWWIWTGRHWWVQNVVLDALSIWALKKGALNVNSICISIRGDMFTHSGSTERKWSGCTSVTTPNMVHYHGMWLLIQQEVPSRALIPCGNGLCFIWNKSATVNNSRKYWNRGVSIVWTESKQTRFS